LPPSGYYAKLPDGELEVFSAVKNGKRGDYVHSPAYDFIDGRGTWLETPWGASDGQLIILKRDDGSREIIPNDAGNFAIVIDEKPKTIVALDENREEMEQTNGELRNGLFYIQPVKEAISYMLKF
jgi:hypothetical protein